MLDGKKLHYKEEFASIPIKRELDSDVENFEILEPVEADIAEHLFEKLGINKKDAKDLVEAFFASGNCSTPSTQTG